MNAAQLLASITERGATARAEIGDDGAAVLVVAPRNVIGDLLPDLARFKPALLELLADEDTHALELLARHRRGGVLLELEEIEHDGAAWLALACDLTNVHPTKRDAVFARMQRDARALQKALELEADEVTT